MQNFNPYGAFQPQFQQQFQQPQFGSYGQFQQPQQNTQPIQPLGISGKIVRDFNEITIQDIPTDCSPAFFIKSDYSEIQSRRWSDTGSVIPVTYKAVMDCADEQEEKPFDKLNRRLDDIEALLTKKPAATTRKKDDEAQ